MYDCVYSCMPYVFNGSKELIITSTIINSFVNSFMVYFYYFNDDDDQQCNELEQQMDEWKKKHKKNK